MIPIIFNEVETSFTSLGMGGLVDVISCTVTQEINGMYELEMAYPTSGHNADKIKVENIITAKPSPYRSPEPFRIYNVSEDIKGILTVNAHHVSYDLSRRTVTPYTAANLNDAIAGISSHMVGSNNFTFRNVRSNIARDFAVKVPVSARQTLGGVEGSILDVYGGEYAFSGFTVVLADRLGSDNGVVVRYGKNLLSAVVNSDTSGSISGVVPYWTDGETVVTANAVYESGAHFLESVIPMDFSADFEEKPTTAQLTARAQAYLVGKSSRPFQSLEVNFIELASSREYANIVSLERCDIGDTVTIQCDKPSIYTSERIVKIVTDAINERYVSVEIGHVTAGISETIASDSYNSQTLEKLLHDLNNGKVDRKGDRMTGTLHAPNFRTVSSGYSSFGSYDSENKNTWAVIGNAATNRIQFEQFATSGDGHGDRYTLPAPPESMSADAYYSIFNSKDPAGARTSMGLNNLANVVIETGYITATSAGAQVTFSKAFPSAPRIVLTGSGDYRTWVSARAATGFKAHANANTRVDWIAVYVP